MLPYSNDEQRIGGMAGEMFSGGAYVKGAQAGAAGLRYSAQALGPTLDQAASSFMVRNRLQLNVVENTGVGGAALRGIDEGVGGANTGRDALIAESRAQSAYLQEKFGSLTSEQRLSRIDELAGANYQRRIGEAIDSQEYVYRYLSEKGLSDSARYGTLRGYTTTEFSMSSAEVANRAQIMPNWGTPQYGVRIPVSDMNGFSIARPMGGKSATGWEPFTNSYPSAGSGGWSQFLLNEVPFNPANVFKLNP